MPKTASIYVRLSKEAGESNVSGAGMLEDCRAVASRHGLDVVAEHFDDGISGAVRDRPEFRAWLEDGRTGTADVLVTWHADRLTREGINAAALLFDVLEGKDSDTGKVVRPPVRLIDHSGLDSAHGDDAFRLRFVVAAEVARAERSRMVERAKAGRRRLRAQARFPGGTPPFGYRVVPGNPGYRLEVDPQQASQLRDIAHRILTGETVNSIVMGFNKQGVPSPADQQRIKQGRPAGGTAWRVSNLNRLMKSPTLLGFATVKSPDGRGYMVIRGDDGHPIQRAEPILTPDELAEVERALESRKGGGTATSKRTPQPFLGVAQCVCGANLYVIAGRSGAGYWRCGRRQQTGICPEGNDRSIRVETMVMDGIEVFRRYAGDVPRTRRELIKGTDNAAELANVDEAISDLMDDRAAGLYRGTEATAKYRQMLSSLENRKAAMEAEGSMPDHVVHIETGETWAEWLDANTHDMRALGETFRAVGLRFVLYPPGALKGRPATRPDDAPVPLTYERLDARGRLRVEPWRVGIEMPGDMRERLKRA